MWCAFATTSICRPWRLTQIKWSGIKGQVTAIDLFIQRGNSISASLYIYIYIYHYIIDVRTSVLYIYAYQVVTLDHAFESR